jgi:glutamate racemase
MQQEDKQRLTPGPIGVFDSGYGGLTILKEIRQSLPQYDYIYLGDNARAPYGSRSFHLVYEFTLQACKKLFDMGCNLIILACNTASAKALRTIQQTYLPSNCPDKRVLGVIRPTVEVLPEYTKTGHIGLLATNGTVNSHSYAMEIEKLYPQMQVTEQACPLLVPLIENRELNNVGTDYFIRKYVDSLLENDREIDTIILGCTHYPLLLHRIKEIVPAGINILSQGETVGMSLTDYLNRHTDMAEACLKNGACQYFTTEDSDKFDESASLFLGYEVKSQHINLG